LASPVDDPPKGREDIPRDKTVWFLTDNTIVSVIGSAIPSLLKEIAIVRHHMWTISGIIMSMIGMSYVPEVLTLNEGGLKGMS